MALQMLKSAIGAVSPTAAAKISIWNRTRNALSSGEPELHLVPALCHKDRVSVDVGANVGLYSYAALPYSKRVIALEPHPHMARLLRDWGGNRLTVMEIAASDSEGTATLTIPLDHGRERVAMSSLHSTPLLNRLSEDNQVHRIEIRMARADDLDLGSIGFLKIDVEGHEMEVIAGALATIGRCRPNILVESEERHRAGAPAWIKGQLEALGYQGFFLQGNVLTSVLEFSTEKHQSYDRGLGSRTRGAFYFNNFIYLPDDTAVARVKAAAAQLPPGQYTRQPR